MGGSASSNLYSGLLSGLSRDEAENLWTQVDKNRNGLLDRNEARALVGALIDQSIVKLTAAKNDEKYVDHLMKCFDRDGLGIIAKDDFIEKAIVGYSVPLDLSDSEDYTTPDEGEEPSTVAAVQKEKSFKMVVQHSKKRGIEEGGAESSDASAKKARVEDNNEESAVERQSSDPSSEKAGAGEPKKGLAPGVQAKIVNAATPEGKPFNGRKVTLVRWNPDKKRWIVRFGPVLVPVRPENLEFVRDAV